VYCSKCGAAMADSAAFCSSCGQAVGSAVVSPQTQAANTAVVTPAGMRRVAAPPAYAPAAYAEVPRVEYAGFWLRLFAFMIDNFIIGVGFVLILIPLIFLTPLRNLLSEIHFNDDPGDMGAFAIFGLIFLAATVSLLVTWLYHALMESSEWQATVGKRALGMVVTDMEGKRVTFLRSTGRHFGKIVTNLIPMFIGYIMAGFTEKKQALHDMLAGCVVLHKNS
jgi:uncharacterized RDD family membrane protein YckC